MSFSVCFLEDEPFSKFGQLLKERICSDKSKFFFLRVNPTERGVKRKKNETVLPKNMLICLNKQNKGLPWPEPDLGQQMPWLLRISGFATHSYLLGSGHDPPSTHLAVGYGWLPSGHWSGAGSGKDKYH